MCVCRVRIELDYYQQTACLTVPHPTQSIMCRRNNATRRQYNIVALMLYTCRKSSHDCGDYECSHYVLCCVCKKEGECNRDRLGALEDGIYWAHADIFLCQMYK